MGAIRIFRKPTKSSTAPPFRLHTLKATTATQAATTQLPVFDRTLPDKVPGTHSTPHMKKTCKIRKLAFSL